jgi:hypothetical protein
MIICHNWTKGPILVAARSQGLVCGRSDAGIADAIPNGYMSVCLSTLNVVCGKVEICG